MSTLSSSLPDTSRGCHGQNVVFCGIDGSGKTTAARASYTYLRLRGFNVCLHWFRGSHLAASILLRLLSRFNAFRGVCNPYYRVCVPSKLRGLWALVEFLNLIPHLVTRLMLQHICFIVGDRGALDSAVWIAATLKWLSFLKTIPGRFLLALASKENIVYLYAEPMILLRRCDIPRDFFLRELALYNALAKHFARLSIDTGRWRPAQVVARILKYLEIT